MRAYLRVKRQSAIGRDVTGRRKWSAGWRLPGGLGLGVPNAAEPRTREFEEVSPGQLSTVRKSGGGGRRRDEYACAGRPSTAGLQPHGAPGLTPRAYPLNRTSYPTVRTTTPPAVISEKR